ncbi:hypothetical protein ACHAW6_004334 [Cyclotella cf. meneghiniana]
MSSQKTGRPPSQCPSRCPSGHPPLQHCRMSTIAPAMSTWEHYNDLFNFNTTPLGPIVCPVIIHNNPSTC